MTSSSLESSIIGTAILNEDVFLNSSIVGGNITNGVYYSKLFMKPSANNWYQLSFISNQNITTTNININTLGKFKISFNVRVGNNLPFNYSTNTNYSLSDFNSLIQTTTPENIDSLMYRETIGRSLTSSTSTAIIPPPNNAVFNMGSALAYSRLASSTDALWSYWSVPAITFSPSYLFPSNPTFNYLQLRIALENIGTIQDPETNLQHFAELYEVQISSILTMS